MRTYTPGGIANWDAEDEQRKADLHELLTQPTIAQQVFQALSDEVDAGDPDRTAIIWKYGELIQLGWEADDPTLIGKARFLVEYERKRRVVEKRTPTPRPPLRVGQVVYYIQIRDTIKIGFTSQDPERRRRGLAGDRILAIEPGSMELEAERHRQFAAYRADIPGTRERFHPSDELMDHIVAIREQHADIQVG
jgi:hypothetical protein